MRLTWPLVGRGEEMRLIGAALSDPGVSGIVVSGSAGVGKSRIAREALAAAAADGREVRWVVGTSCGRGIPLGGLASWPGLVGDDSLALVCGVVDSLTAASSAGAVVGVDDPHLLDDLSLFVLDQIVSRGVAKVLLTVRSDELIPAAIQELWTFGEFERVDLQPLSLDQVTALLSATLDAAMDPHTARSLWQLTQGNTLYLRHIVEDAVGDGHLEKQSGHWRWVGDPVVGHGLVELVESRMGALPDAVGTVVDALAIGEPIELATLRRIVSAHAVEDADVRGLIRLDEIDERIEVRSAHPLYGEVRRRRAAPTRLRRLRGLLASELAAADEDGHVPALVRRGALTLDSDLEPDPPLLIGAAQGAIALGDLALADRLAGASVRAGGGPEAQFLRAHALSWLGRGREAEELLASIPVGGLTDEQRARFTYLRASNLLWALADPVRAKGVIDDGAAAVVQGPARRSIEAVSAVYWFAMDQPDAALAASRNLVLDELAPIVGAEMAWALASIHGDAGRTAEAVGAAEAGYAIAIRCSDAPHMRFNIADAHVGALVLAGRIGEALEVADSAGGQAADLPGAAHLLGPAIAGRAALGTGRLEEACALLEQAAGALAATGHELGWGYRYGVPRATALAMRGRVRDAAAALEELDELGRPFRLLNYEKALARASIAAGEGAVSEAVGMLRSAGQVACASGRFALEVMCLQAATQLGDGSCGARLRELEPMVEGPRVRLAARFAEALDSGHAAELADISAAFAEMGDRLAAVDAAAAASLAYRRRDRRGSALGCAAQAESLAQLCGATTPMLRQAREPLPFTDREREIISLIGQGMSNRDVAQRLTLSTRTVEGHIYRAMSKTGTSSREELAALLSPRNPSTRD
ncbi:helix-turn-helix transcriptional regulator [Mycolicibacterium moriokaense]|nr:helix-turn-helix transcriptional regulator [Mycolicibacterium moriokaense]